jgi:hypothetical protein
MTRDMTFAKESDFKPVRLPPALSFRPDEVTNKQSSAWGMSSDARTYQYNAEAQHTAGLSDTESTVIQSVYPCCRVSIV